MSKTVKKKPKKKKEDIINMKELKRLVEKHSRVLLKDEELTFKEALFLLDELAGFIEYSMQQQLISVTSKEVKKFVDSQQKKSKEEAPRMIS